MITPPLGLNFSRTIRIDPALVVPGLPAAFPVMADMPPVFATAFMIAFVEATCIEALAPYLEAGEATVGTGVDMRHVGGTPIGLDVTAEVELTAVEGRRLRFRVACQDEAEPVGDGWHERFLIDRERFAARLEAKRIGLMAHL
jgi:fluoroacetyl-CoA thioesterase